MAAAGGLCGRRRDGRSSVSASARCLRPSPSCRRVLGRAAAEPSVRSRGPRLLVLRCAPTRAAGPTISSFVRAVVEKRATRTRASGRLSGSASRYAANTVRMAHVRRPSWCERPPRLSLPEPGCFNSKWLPSPDRASTKPAAFSLRITSAHVTELSEPSVGLCQRGRRRAASERVRTLANLHVFPQEVAEAPATEERRIRPEANELNNGDFADPEVGVDDGTRTRSVRSHSPVLYL